MAISTAHTAVRTHRTGYAAGLLFHPETPYACGNVHKDSLCLSRYPAMRADACGSGDGCCMPLEEPVRLRKWPLFRANRVSLMTAKGT